jgi:iron complex transport system ATP-binding protein
MAAGARTQGEQAVTALEASGLSIGYGQTVVASGIDLSLIAGQVTCLLGPNGVGKTTLFKTLLGLIPPLAGTVQLGGEDFTGLSRAQVARHVAYVPQAHPPAFAYTVLDLVIMGRTAHLGPFGQPSQHDYANAMAALSALGIASLADRDSMRISGGQRQLALIARALAQEARIMIMDEPTASLDLGNRVLVLDRIREMAARGLAVLLSTHEPEQAFDIADHVAALTPQKEFKTGSAKAVLTPQRLSELYGVDLTVEETQSGRLVVSRRGGE